MHPIRIEPVLDSEPTTLRGRISEFPEVVQFAQDFVGRVPYDALRALGVYKSLDTPFWPAHTIVTFPFYRDLESRSDVEGCLSQMRTAQVEAAHIYVHVPFCTAVCDYCAYSRIGSVGEDRVGAYIVALRSEVKWWKAHFGGRLPSASSIYFGGGTPTSISLDALGELLDTVDEQFGGHEVRKVGRTCEVSPETVLEETGSKKLKKLAEHGFSRISMGVQSFSSEIAADINRRHSGVDAAVAIQAIRDAGHEDLNIDLMYGLPGQTLSDWANSLLTAVDLNLPSITLHQLKVKAKSPLSTPKQISRTAGWTQERLLLFACVAKALLHRHGYTQMGTYRYVRDPEEANRYYAQKYNMGNLLGLGCSSYSFYGGCTTYNATNQADYRAAVSVGGTPLKVGRPLTFEELQLRYLIYGLRIGIAERDIPSLQSNSSGAMVGYDLRKLKRFAEAGLIDRIHDGRLRFSDLGFLYANEIGLALAASRAYEATT